MHARDRDLPRKFRVYGSHNLHTIPQLGTLPEEDVHDMRVVSAVLPFRVNAYVLEELIDWDEVPDDPIFRLTFPHREMLEPDDFARMHALLREGAARERVEALARDIRRRLNPHPAGQSELNVPRQDGRRLSGIQHKYRETVLFFPSQGQTCHAYCSYCFRWPQFAGDPDQRFASSEGHELAEYLRRHPEVRSVLFTGGDPFVMRSELLQRYVEPLLAMPTVTSIRFGTKALSYWPHRFTQGPDADALLRLFERIIAAGKTVAVMGHYSHPRELAAPAAEQALSRVLSTGAVVRCQAPIVRHVNDRAEVWAALWQRQVQLGAVPYYMFVARDTGAQRYFEVPLVDAFRVYRKALASVSGLARTARGPSMSCHPGKVVIDGVATVEGQEVFVLRLLQARNPDWVGQPFFAKLDPQAVWFDQLTPAFGRPFFFARELEERWGGLRQAHRLRVLQDADDDEAA